MTSILVSFHLLLFCFLLYSSDAAKPSVTKNGIKCLLMVLPNKCSLHNNKCIRSTCYVFDPSSSLCKTEPKCTPNKGDELCPPEDCHVAGSIPTTQAKPSSTMTQDDQTKTSDFEVNTETAKTKQDTTITGHQKQISTTDYEQKSPTTYYEKPNVMVLSDTTKTWRKRTKKIIETTIDTRGNIYIPNLVSLLQNKMKANGQTITVRRNMTTHSSNKPQNDTVTSTKPSTTTTEPIYKRAWFIALMGLVGLLLFVLIIIIIICCCCRKRKVSSKMID